MGNTEFTTAQPIPITGNAIYEIINPSDPYSLESSDWKTACLAVIILGEGQYSLKEIDGEREMPIFMFGGCDEWMQEHFGQSLKEAFDTTDKITIAEVLESVVIGNREVYRKGLSLIDDPEKRIEWRDSWQDKNRSSLSNIGQHAWNLAASLRRKAGVQP